MTVLQAIQRSAEFLGWKGVDSPRLQAELLLADVLHVPRMELYLNFERVLSQDQEDGYRQRVKRRGQREPLQLILGNVSFCGLEIHVTRQALIPRPETELLAECGWKFLNQITAPADEPRTALDLGTGTGCIALALAAHCPQARIWALDSSEEALEACRENASRLGLAERVCFLRSDGFASLPPEARFDLLISNPPYIPTAEIEQLQPEVRDYEPRTALDGGPDGLVFYRRLAAEAAAFLKPGGRLMLEFGDGQAEPLQRLFTEQKWIVEQVLDDYTHRQRILIASK